MNDGCEGGGVVSCQLKGTLAGTGRLLYYQTDVGGAVTEPVRGEREWGLGAERSSPGPSAAARTKQKKT